MYIHPILLFGFVTMGILGYLQKPERGNKYFVVITDCYLKVIKIAPTAKPTADKISMIIMEHQVVRVVIPSTVPMDNEPQITSTSILFSIRKCGGKTVATTEYYPLANVQVERSSTSMISILRHYVAEHWKNYNRFLFPLTSAYHVHLHRSTRLPHSDWSLLDYRKDILL